MLLPYFDGERTPNLPDATGVLAGLRSDTEPAQLARAAYEGVVCGLLDALDALGATPVSRPTAAGCRRRRRCAFRRVPAADRRSRSNGRSRCHPPAEYVARGACVQAAAVLTGRAVADVAREWAPVRPRSSNPNVRVDAASVRAAYAELRPAPIPSREQHS